MNRPALKMQQYSYVKNRRSRLSKGCLGPRSEKVRL